MIRKLILRSRRNLQRGVLGQMGWGYLLVAAPWIYLFRVVKDRPESGQLNWADAGALGMALGFAIVAIALLLVERQRRRAE